MGLRPVFGDTVLSSAARGAGTHVSGPAAAAGMAADVLLMVHVTAVSGTPTLNCSLEQSADGSSWSAVPGSSTTQLTAAGNAVAAAGVTANFVRITATVAGTTPSVTFKAALLVVPE
ncbi:hypothetical protein [Spongiactinospora sp. TRM90649]|uniref:hypothetical protein n=1 Tax=Spongiactinospora sp. TRM90649 TaxID=3031114 RepID=UPI0023F87481|nr:hypothetical protein [Spongiactinospora sp. TRM90649]MDF5755816.1 hypothetical protein [Spongiactinospora sp. TRM90649]